MFWPSSNWATITLRKIPASTNPSGFYIHLVEENTPLPPGFETSAQRQAREESERRREEERRAQQELESDYDDYRTSEINRYIAALDPAEVAAVEEAKRQEVGEKHTSPWIIDSFTKYETRRELAKRAPLMTIEEFEAKRRQAIAVSQEPAAVAPPLAGEPELQTSVTEPEAPLQQAEHVPAAGPPPGEERGAAIQPAPDSGAPLVMPAPAVQMVSEPVPMKPVNNSPEPHIA